MVDPTTEIVEAPELDRHVPQAATTAASLPRRRFIDWRPIFLEAFFVVLGVVLALAANEWRQASVDRREAATALESIREELETNRTAVLRSLEYHLYLADTLGVIRRQASADRDDSTSFPNMRVFTQGFVHPATLLSTAWEAAAATETVRHMEHDDVLTLAGIYEQQRRYATQSEQIGALIYGEIFARGTTGMIRNYGNLASIIGAFWYRECDLLAGYDRALTELRGNGGQVTAVPNRCRPATRR